MTRWIALLGIFVATLATADAAGQELYVLDTQGQTVRLPEVPTTPVHERPVLFVHGHNPFSVTDADFQFRKDWIDPLEHATSFAQTLRASSNAGLKLEPYFLRLVDQSRSMVADAGDVRAAIDVILRQHDVNYDAQSTHPVSDVRIVLVAYGKGTISARLALKSLVESVDGLPAPVAFKPVSEFIAIAPPNHGVVEPESPLAGLRSGAELANGMGPSVDGVCAPLGDATAREFLTRLNGHPSADSHASRVPLAAYPSEAPGSRPPGAPAKDGVLYVTLYPAGNRGAVGGDAPPGSDANAGNLVADCVTPVQQGRLLARNLSPDAINLALPGIAGADALSVHRNSVHSATVICHALHTAVHRRPPVDTECGSNSQSAPTIAAPRRVAIELVLDYSQSMQHAACVDCAPKAAMLADAAQLFLDMWSLFAEAGDHVDVSYFRTEVTQTRCLDEVPCDTVSADTAPLEQTLLPLRVFGPRIRTHLMSQTTDGRSALGKGLGGALTRLASFDGASKRVLVMSDGAQNEAPLLETQAGSCPDNVCGLRIAAQMPVALDSSLGVRVDTIGIGGGDAPFSLLNHLAHATGGSARLTRNPERDLALFVIDELMDVLSGYGAQRVARRRGELTTANLPQTFIISAAARRLVFYSRGDTELRIAKDGVDVTAAGRRIVRPGYRLWTLRLPATVDGQKVGTAGEWQVQPGGRIGQAFDLAAIVDEPRLGFDVTTGVRRYRVGDALDLNALVRVDGVPLNTPVDLSVRVFRPGDSLGNLIASPAFARGGVLIDQEQGATPGEQNVAYLLQDKALRAKLAAAANSLPMTATGIGQYHTASAPLTRPGIHMLEFNLSGEHPNLGRFERSKALTVHVGFGDAAFKSSKFDVRRVRDEDGARVLTLTVTPRDQSGNFLGPGFASQLDAALAGNWQAPSLDVGDGGYVFALRGDAPRDAALAIRVSGRPLMDGLLSDVEPPPPPPERPLWQYLVAFLLILLVPLGFRRFTR